MAPDTLERAFPSLKDPSLFRQQCYVDGKWSDAEGGATLKVDNPATGAIIGTAPRMGAAETRRAIDAAAKAWPAWRAKTAKERSAILRRWYELMLAHADDLALVLTTEQGKPFAEAKGEIGIAAAYVEWFAEEAKRVYGDVIPTVANDRRLVVVKEPVGVCAAITPWNFPCVDDHAQGRAGAGRRLHGRHQAGRSHALLGAGARRARASRRVSARACSTSSPATRRRSAARCAPIRRCASCRSLARPVGRLLMQQVAPTVKKLSLELGGNAPFIVFDDADLDAAAEGAIVSKYRNAGQTCVCTNRFFVHDAVYDAFADEAVEQGRRRSRSGPERSRASRRVR